MGLFGSKKTTTTTKIPDWLEAGSQQAVELGRRIAARPYQGYTGPVVAGMSQNEQQASELARFGSEAPRSYLERADEQLSALETFDQADISAYMNPYTQAVLEPRLQEANRQYERSRAALLNSKAGAWGGDRAAFEASELERLHRENIDRAIADTYHQAFETARQAWSQDQTRRLQAVDALRAVGGDVARLNAQQIQDLMRTGEIDRVLRQAQLDFDLAQFREARDWDIYNLDPLLQSLRVPTSVTQEQKQSGGVLGQLLGAAVSLGAGYFTGGASLGLQGLAKMANEAVFDELGPVEPLAPVFPLGSGR